MNIYDYFEESLKKHPENTALVVDGREYTYHQIAEEATQLSRAIPENDPPFTGLLAYRSLAAFAGVLGILKAGKGYVPLNPKFPAKRLATMIDLADLDTLIVENQYLPLLAKILEHTEKQLKIIPTNPDLLQKQQTDFLKHHQVILPVSSEVVKANSSANKRAGTFAYMLFTSGSTGKPKGVPITHQNVHNYVKNINHLMQFTASARFTNTFDLTFDLSVHDMFVSWSNAAALYCIPEKSLMAPARFLKKNKISCWFSVPSVANVMNRLRMLKENAFPDMRYALFCGEPLLIPLAEKWQKAAPAATLFNIYGPTEATIGISAYNLPKKGIKNLNGMVSIGKLFSGNNMKIADENFNEVSEGELLLSGNQLIKQYWKNPEKTKKAFTALDGIPWYHTGDIVNKDSDGDLFFVERKDFQVKIQGYRVELNEIDYVVSSYTGTEEVKTIVISGSNQMNKLVTCMIKPQAKGFEARDIISHCKNTLPAYMVPESVKFFSSFPRNQNGKTDVRKLQDLVVKETTNNNE